jgi:hypothetical protein
MSEAPDRAGSVSSWSRAPSVASSLHAASSSRPTTPRGSVTAGAAEGGPVSLADVGSLGGGRAWDGIPATTAASMLWEDMMKVRSVVGYTAGSALVDLIGDDGYNCSVCAMGYVGAAQCMFCCP